MGSATSIGKVLKIARHANNMSTARASLMSDVSQIYISEIERRKKCNISYEILKKLAKTYGLESYQLLELEDYYSSLDVEEERKFRLTLIKTLEMMESNYKNNQSMEAL